MPLQRTSPYKKTSPRHCPKDTADASTSSAEKKGQTSQAIFNQKSLQASRAHLKKTANLDKDLQQSPPHNHRKSNHHIASHHPESLHLETSNRAILKNLASPEEAKTLLFKSAYDGDLELIQDLIQKGYDLSSKNHGFKDAVLIAYEAKHFSCASALLYAKTQRSSSPDRLYAYYEYHQFSPLFYAIDQKDQALLKLCIQTYSSQLHTYHRPISDKGISQNRDSVLMEMIRHHLDIENPHLLTEEMLKVQNTQGYTALMLAIETQNPSIYNTILKYSTDISAQNNQGSNALHLAIFKLNDFELIQTLLDKGIDPTVESEVYGNALHASIQTPNLALVERFAHWENMRIITPELLKTLCRQAIEIGQEYFSIFSYLWKHTHIASLDYSAFSKFTHPLIEFSSTINPPHQTSSDSVMRQLDLIHMILNRPHQQSLESQASVHIRRSRDRNTAMMLALKSNHLEAFHLLFKHALDHSQSSDWITLRNAEQEDLFMIAFSQEAYEIARNILLHILEMPDAQKSKLFNFYAARKLSPLFLATHLKDPRLFDACLPFCSNLHLLENKEKSSLPIALIMSRMDIPLNLLSRALLSKENKYGNTPLNAAIETGNDIFIHQLETLGYNFIEERAYGNAFTLAAYHQSLDLIKKFASMDGMNLHAINSSGQTAFDILLLNTFNKTAVEYLLNHEKFIQTLPQNKIYTTFLALLETGDLQLLHLYLQKVPIDFSMEDPYGCLALKVAAKQKDPNILQELMNLGIYIHKESFHTFAQATLENKNYPILEWILRNDASGMHADLLELMDPNDGCTLLMKLLKSNNNFPNSLLQAILSFDFDASIQHPVSKENALMLSIFRNIPPENRHSEFLQILNHISQRNTKRLDVINQEGKTALFMASELQQSSSVRALLFSGANPNIQHRGYTPYQECLSFYHIEDHRTRQAFLEYFQQTSEAKSLGLPPDPTDPTKYYNNVGALFLAECLSTECNDTIYFEALLKISSTEWILRDLLTENRLSNRGQLKLPNILNTLLIRFQLTKTPIPQDKQTIIWLALLDSPKHPQSLQNLQLFLEICPLQAYDPQTKETPLKWMENNIQKYLPYIQMIAEKTPHITPKLAGYFLLKCTLGTNIQYLYKLLDIFKDNIQPPDTLAPEESPFLKV